MAATKGIRISDSIADEEKASGNITTVFATITGVQAQKKGDGSGDYDCEIFVKYHRTEAAYDANKKDINSWDALKTSYKLSMSEADLDSEATSCNNAFYNALEAAMGADFSSLTKVNK